MKRHSYTPHPQGLTRDVCKTLMLPFPNMGIGLTQDLEA